MKKIKSVQFNYEDGDSVKVLATNEAEEHVFDSLRSAVTGNRAKHGNIEGITVAVIRESRISVGMAGSLPDILKGVDGQMKGLVESDAIPDTLRALFGVED